MKRRRIKVDPTIVLTRPAHQAIAFADDLVAAHGSTLPLLIAPLIKIAPITPERPIGAPDHVIFTSANGVAQAKRLGVPTTAIAWCVGEQTSQAAAALGFRTQSTMGDSSDLVAAILAAQPQGDILHLRGAHVTGRVVEALLGAGLRCSARIVYDQIACPASVKLKTALAGVDPLIIPLFSPRSARLLAEVGPIHAPTTLIAMSPSVAAATESCAVTNMVTVDVPDKKHMVTATLQSFDALCGRKTP